MLINDAVVVATEVRKQIKFFAEQENESRKIVWGKADNLEGFCFYSSLLFVEVCKQLEIPRHETRMICGYFGKGKRVPANHFWNQIRIGRRWQVVDITATQFFPASQMPFQTEVWFPKKEEVKTWYKPRYIGYRAREFGETHWDECQNPLFPKENFKHIEKLIERSLKNLERTGKTVTC